MANDITKLVGVAIPVASVVLLASVIMGVKRVFAPGELVASGERKVGVNDTLYEWQVVGSIPGSEFPLTGQAKMAGLGTWNAETIVAMGPDKDTAVGNVIAYLSALA